MLQSITECYRVLQTVTERYRVLQSVIEYYIVLQSVTKCYRVFGLLLSATEYNIVLQTITEYYRVFLAHLLGPISGLVSIIATFIYIFVRFSVLFLFHRLSHNLKVCQLWQGVKTSPGTLSATTRPADVLGLNCSTVTIGWLACEQMCLQNIFRKCCISSFLLSCDTVPTI